MLSTSRTLLEHPSVKEHLAKASPGNLEGMENALFRAREVFLAGWELTPEETLKFVGNTPWDKLPGDPAVTCPNRQEEDEASEVPLFFSEV
jgi:hypothetical protein